jgi:hypothetical protein
MHRRHVLAVPLAAFVLACAPSQVEPVYATKAELSIAPAEASTCGGSALLQTGKPSTLEVRGHLVTSSCACKSKTTDFYGDEVCTSAYDLGVENPQVCEAVETNPAMLETVSGSAGFLDCTVTAAIDASDRTLARITVQCPIPGSAWVIVKAKTTTGDDAEYRYLLDVSDDGKCPVSQP